MVVNGVAREQVMHLRQIGLLAVIGVGGAFGFGVLANAVLDVVWPLERVAAAPQAPAKVPQIPVQQPEAAAPAAPATPASMTLASASSKPVRLDTPAENVIGTKDVRPVKVKTVQMVLANPDPDAPATTLAYAGSPPAPQNPASAALMPKPRPTVREAAAHPVPKAPAKPKHNPEDDQLVLSDGQIERIKTALALTPDQEAYWPAIAAELRAIGRAQPKRSATKGAAPKLHVDDDSVQRLYTAATPLVMRLREDQKKTVRQLALMLGLQEVASAI